MLLELVRAFGKRDAGAAVAHVDRHPRAVGPSDERDRRLRRRVARGVAHEVHEHLQEPRAIDEHDGKLRRNVDLERVTIADRRERVGHLGEQRRGCDGPQLDVE